MAGPLDLILANLKPVLGLFAIDREFSGRLRCAMKAGFMTQRASAKLTLRVVRCDSAECEASGGNIRDILLWGPPAAAYKLHKVVCPYCEGAMDRNVDLEELVKVERPSMFKMT